MAKSGLGKGLGALISVSPALRSPEPDAGEQVQQVALGSIVPSPLQPRREFAREALEELIDSIRQRGIIQPLIVRPVRDTYELIAGERRWRAAQLAVLDHIPALVRDIPDELAIALALIENIQREDLNPMEQAVALQRFHDEFGMSHQEIADTVGKARATVSNLLRLMSLHDDVKTMLDHGDLDMGHARALLALKSQQQLNVAKTIVEKVLSVRQTEQLIRDLLNPPQTKAKPASATTSADVEQLSRRLSERFGASVELEHNQKGKGRMVIRYHSLDELDGILALIDPQ
jgi:ParB family chromosome partitioning protein